jgi:GNAT superfamily N-acetyltransferase
MPGEVTFRIARRGDHNVVVQLLAELVEEIGPAEMAERVKPKLDHDIDEALHADNVRIFVAEADGEVVGLSRGDVLTTDPIFRLRDDHRCGYIDQMYVRPSYRGTGIGKALLEQCEDWFRRQGIGHCLLHSAPRATRFYGRAGYQPNREMFKRL